MADLDDIDLDFDAHDVSWLRRAVAGIGRAIWWLVWDFGCEWLGWTVGWFTCRLVSVGRFPAEGWDEEEHAPWWAQLLVMLVGWVVLGSLAWLALGLLGR